MSARFAVITDTQIFFTQKTGGASVYWYELLSRMIADPDVDVHLLLAKGKYDNLQMDNLDLSKVSLHIENAQTNNQLRAVSPSLPTGLDLPTVFHSSYLRMPSRGKCVKVLTAHDFTHQRYFPFYKAVPNYLLKKAAIRKTDGIISISNSTRNDLLHFFPEAANKRNITIYNGASADYRIDSKCEATESVERAANNPYVLFVGARRGYKNFSMVEETMKSIPELHLIAVGGEEERESSLPASQITWLRGLSNSDLNYLYNHAVCLFYPSLYEGFGIPVAEATRAGCPVVAINASSIPEVAASTSTLLCEGDVSSAISCIRKLLSNPIDEVELRAAANSAARFSWDNCYKQTKRFYEELLCE